MFILFFPPPPPPPPPPPHPPWLQSPLPSSFSYYCSCLLIFLRHCPFASSARPWRYLLLRRSGTLFFSRVLGRLLGPFLWLMNESLLQRAMWSVLLELFAFLFQAPVCPLPRRILLQCFLFFFFLASGSFSFPFCLLWEVWVY